MFTRSGVSFGVVGLGVTILAGCQLQVGPSSPRPNVMVATDKQPTRLKLTNNIRDTFRTPHTASVRSVSVTGWRGTLHRGFVNAFRDRRAGGRTLEVRMAELSYAPAAVGSHGTAAVVTHIRFQARLLDASGSVLGGLAGTVRASRAATHINDLTNNTRLAVEALYEHLTAKLLSKY